MDSMIWKHTRPSKCLSRYQSSIVCRDFSTRAKLSGCPYWSLNSSSISCAGKASAPSTSTSKTVSLGTTCRTLIVVGLLYTHWEFCIWNPCWSPISVLPQLGKLMSVKCGQMQWIGMQSALIYSGRMVSTCLTSLAKRLAVNAFCTEQCTCLTSQKLYGCMMRLSIFRYYFSLKPDETSKDREYKNELNIILSSIPQRRSALDDRINMQSRQGP